jgi:hypothetical protein
MKLSQRERVKRHLLLHGTITNVEAVEMKILRLSERIRELQAEGLEIDGAWLPNAHGRPTIYRYTLVGKPVSKPKMVPQVVMIDGVRHVRLVPESV